MNLRNIKALWLPFFLYISKVQNYLCKGKELVSPVYTWNIENRAYKDGIPPYQATKTLSFKGNYQFIVEDSQRRGVSCA